VGFFEELPDPAVPERHPSPPWIGPPGNEAPVAVPLQLVVGRSDRAAVLLGGLRVYSIGIELDATILLRDEPSDFHFFDPLHQHPGQPKDTVLRLAVVCADGSQGEAMRFPPREEAGRVLTPNGGGGGQGRWTHRLWLWPLPPPGAVDVVCAWPAFGIGEAWTSFDAGPVLEAAKHVEQLWPENAEPSGGGGSVTMTRMYGTGDGA